jgi:ABC-type uncharacterized transport system involved in gliding motility auxiliary subunit
MELRKQDKAVLSIGLVILTLALLNSLVFFVRVDLTENKAYSISPVTAKLVQTLPEPVRLNYYVSGVLRNQIPAIQGIADILYEYARVSNGKVEVKIIDTDGREAELRPEDYGIQSQEFQVTKNNQFTNTLVYTGILVSYLDNTKVLPVVTNPAAIEYDLTSAIRSLATKKTPVLGVLSGANANDITGKYTMLSQIFQKGTEFRNLAKGEAIPADVDVLFVFAADGLGAFDLWNVDQFLMSGKGVLIGQDTERVDLSSNWQATPVPRGLINDLLDKYGVVLGNGWVLDDSCRNIPFNQRQGQMTIQRLLPYPEWVAVTGKGLNQTNPISARSAGLDLLWASPVELKEGATGEALASSSAAAWVMEGQPIADPQQVLAQHRQQRAAQSAAAPKGLVVLRTGMIESGFQGKDLTTLVPDRKLPTGIKSVAHGRLLVVGDSDFASDLYQTLAQNGLVGNAANVVFLQNAFEYLSNDTEMMELRTRQIWDKRLTNITDPAMRDAWGTSALILNAVLVPLGLVAFGVIRAIRRRRGQNQEA